MQQQQRQKRETNLTKEPPSLYSFDTHLKNTLTSLLKENNSRSYYKTGVFSAWYEHHKVIIVELSLIVLYTTISCGYLLELPRYI